MMQQTKNQDYQEMISMEEYLGKRQKIREEENRKARKLPRTTEGAVALELAGLYV